MGWIETCECRYRVLIAGFNPTPAAFPDTKDELIAGFNPTPAAFPDTKDELISGFRPTPAAFPNTNHGLCEAPPMVTWTMINMNPGGVPQNAQSRTAIIGQALRACDVECCRLPPDSSLRSSPGGYDWVMPPALYGMDRNMRMPV